MAPSIATKPLEHLLKQLIIRIGLTMARSREVRLQRLLVHGALVRIRVLSDGRLGDPTFERGSGLGCWRPDAADRQLGRGPHRGQTLPVRFDDFRGHRDVSRIIEFVVYQPLKQTSD
jgi:hypothetical protein